MHCPEQSWDRVVLYDLWRKISSMFTIGEVESRTQFGSEFWIASRTTLVWLLCWIRGTWSQSFVMESSLRNGLKDSMYLYLRVFFSGCGVKIQLWLLPVMGVCGRGHSLDTVCRGDPDSPRKLASGYRCAGDPLRCVVAGPGRTGSRAESSTVYTQMKLPWLGSVGTTWNYLNSTRLNLNNSLFSCLFCVTFVR